MKKFWLTPILFACLGCVAVAAQTDRSRDPNTPCVVVAGAVHVPMRLELKGKTLRMHEALAFAGGWTQQASGTVRLIRTEQTCYAEEWAHKTWPDHELKITELNLKDIQRGDEVADPSLHPGDVLLVIESDPIYVVGSVWKPQTIYFTHPPTLLKAIELAGGAVNATSETRVVILRPGDDKHYKEFLSISLGELKQHPKRNPMLRANDIVTVGPIRSLIPPSPPKYDSPPLFNRPAVPATNRVQSVAGPIYR